MDGAENIQTPDGLTAGAEQRGQRHPRTDSRVVEWSRDLQDVPVERVDPEVADGARSGDGGAVRRLRRAEKTNPCRDRRDGRKTRHPCGHNLPLNYRLPTDC